MLRAYVLIGLIAAAAAENPEQEEFTSTTDSPTTDAPPSPPARPNGAYLTIFKATMTVEGDCCAFEEKAAAAAVADGLTGVAQDGECDGLEFTLKCPVTVTKYCWGGKECPAAGGDTRRRLTDEEEKFTAIAQVSSPDPTVDLEPADVKTAAGEVTKIAGYTVTEVEEVTTRARLVYPPRPQAPPISPAPSPPPPSPPCNDPDGCFDYGGPQCKAAFSKCSSWNEETGMHGPTSVEEVMKTGPYTCCDPGYICSPGGLNPTEGVFGGKTCTAEECKYWSCKPRVDGIESIKEWKALFEEADKDGEEDEGEPPCVDDPDDKYKAKFCRKKKSQGKCDPVTGKPRFMKKVCAKTCGFCKAAEGEEEGEAAKDPVAPPACENTEGKKKRTRGLQAWCDKKSTKKGGKACKRKKVRDECCATCEEKSDKWCANGEVKRDYETDLNGYGISDRASKLKDLKDTEKYLGVPGVVALCVCNDNYSCIGEGCYDTDEKGTGYSASCPDCSCEKE